jgi:aldehyde:ferredoxin oxidoreductase
MEGNTINAYAGKILRVNLTTGKIIVESSLKYVRDWLGGSGVGQWILYNEVKQWATPYAPANTLVIGTGPLNGTLAPGASRITADSKNALTLGVGSSNSDGHFAPELKFAGYDHIIIQGKARKPVYLWIKDDRVELKDAFHLWGKTTWKTDEMIKHELGSDNIQILCIGPAGENVARGACIIVNRGRALGRCGLGGVMGSKNLKAIAVRGTGTVKVANPGRFIKAIDEIRTRFEQSEFVKTLTRFGTPFGVKPKQETCGIPYKNFQSLVFPEESYAKWDVEGLQAAYRVRNMGYMACPMPCSRYFWVDHGPYAGLGTEGFQFEALANFSAKLAVDEPTFCIKANAYCNQLGLDIDNAAGAIGWAMECYQRGILKESDTDGLKLRWGDTGVILELIRRIAYREGFGNILGEGCAHAAELVARGSDYFAIHLKGQDLYEVLRSTIGWALGACVSTRGGGHTTGSPVSETNQDLDEEVGEKIYGVRTVSQPLVFEGKAKLVGYFERLHRISNSLGVCHMTTTWFDPHLQGFPEFAELYSAATGWEVTEDDLKRAATRMLNIEKAFNILHAGFSRKHDYPPRRCLEEPIPSGSAKGVKIDQEKWDSLLDEYYEMNNWDKKTAFPTRRCLEDLDLKQIADDLEKAERLGGG